jgi:LysM repeat protein
LQIGGEAAEMLMIARTQRALDSLYSSSFKLGGDTSVSAGPVGGGGKVNVLTDFVSFTRSKGAYAGMSLEGAVVKIRNDWNAAYYGQEVRPVDIVAKRLVSNAGSAELRAALVKATQTGQKEASAKSNGQYHTVEPGDTLYKIAQEYGTSVDELCRLNQITPDQIIYPGQKIRVASGS